MACPHVSGAAALLLGEDNSKSPQKVISDLLDEAARGYLTDLRAGDTNALLYVGAGGAPTLAPTPAPPPGTWEVISGTGCTKVGNCIRSNNYPGAYGNNEACTIDANNVPFKVRSFETESGYDFLTVGGVTYSGTSGPAAGSYSGSISWSSDYSVTASGWELCTAQEVQLPPAAEEVKPASVTIGGILIPIAEQLAAKLGEALVDNAVDWLTELDNSPSTQVSQPQIDAVWISLVNGTYLTWSGKVISAYYHPTRDHSATSKGKLGEIRSVARGGEWAVSAQTRALRGNQAFYNTL